MTFTPEKAREMTKKALEKQEDAKNAEIRRKADYVCERVEILIKEEASKGLYTAEYEREYSHPEERATEEKIGRTAMETLREKGFEASFGSNSSRKSTKLFISWADKA